MRLFCSQIFLTIPDAMGLGLSFGAGEGPQICSSIENKSAVENLPIPDPEGELQYVMNAVRTIRRELKRRSATDWFLW